MSARPSSSPAPAEKVNGHVRHWWKEAVFYQVWPRSFMDSNGDGIGDLRGVIDRLDHIAGLGIDAVWISPHYDSPMVDNGYDIRDYRRVLAEFGTMEDFDALLAAVKARGMRLVVDMVVNHSSDEHAWFVESRASRDNAKRDWYVWRPGRGADGSLPPNDWRSFFSGSAWTRDDATGEWYLHLFDAKQPDLNWETDALRAEVFDLMRFWVDKGVDGFRLDVIAFVSKDQSFPDYPPEFRDRPQDYHANGPRLMEHLREMRREVWRGRDLVAVGEAFGVDFEQAARLVDEETGPLDMLIQFEAVRLDRGEGWRWKPWTLPALKRTFSEQEERMGREAWRTICLTNHDNPRLVSHFGDDREPRRTASAVALGALTMVLKGTPFVYQGDELGMTNYPLRGIEDFDDVEAKNAWREEVETGRVSAEDFLADMNRTSRDHARTPMQWDASPTGGFTTGTPWFHVNPNTATINAAACYADPGSVYHAYRRLIALRKAHPALVYGDYRDLAPEDAQLFVVERRMGAGSAGEGACLAVLNLSGEPARWTLPDAAVGATVLFENGDVAVSGSDVALGPWGVVILAVSPAHGA